MKLVILKNNLKNALDSVSHTIGDNIGLPILKNILIKAENGIITISSTNLETAIVKTVAGKIMEEGSFTVPFSLFNSIISNIQNERIDLEKKDLSMKIKTDNYEAVVQGISSDDYPIIPKINDRSEFLEIDGAVLKESLNQIVSAAQISELRPEISGVMFDLESSSLKLVATDTFRLAEKTLYESDFKNQFSKGIRIIIPLKPVQEILRVIDEKNPVKIYTDESQVLIESNGLEFITRVIDGKFPDYIQIIPKNIETEIVVDRNEFMNALKLASVFSSKNNEIRIKVGTDGKMMEIYSADNSLGENKYLLSADIKGVPVEVSFNWRYFLDGLRNIDSDSVVIKLQGSVKASLLKANSSDSNYFYILMPLTV